MENILWFGNAGFCFIDNLGNRIYFVDPFALNGRAKDKADIIFITHAHFDHFSPNDIEEILKDNTIIVATSDILEKIERASELKLSVEPNKSYQVKGFKFHTIPAYNNHPQRLKFHPKENNWVGYIFELNEQKIYHAGDSDFIPEMKDLKKWNIDIAMLPIGGTYTMEYEEAAQAANAICAKITIPMHYKIQSGGKAKEFEEGFKKLVTNSKVVIMQELQ
jgi:L-ascorbate metabolism protein UlaG (beta-lactamase superfamily)